MRKKIVDHIFIEEEFRHPNAVYLPQQVKEYEEIHFRDFTSYFEYGKSL